MASKSLGTLTLSIVAETGSFVAGMTKAERSSAKWRKQVERDAKRVGKAVGLAATAAVAALGAMVVTSIRQADESRKMAQAVGVSTEALTALTFAATQSGVSQGDLATSLGRLNRSMLDAARGTEAQERAFAALDIAVVDTTGNLRAGDEVLKDLADRFQNMPDGAQKSAIAMELLGRSGAKMIPLLNGGAEGIENLTRQAEALGLVVSDKTAQQAELFNDSLAVMAAVTRGVANQVAENLLPQLSSLAAGMADAATNGNVVSTVAQDISDGLRSAAASAVGAVAAMVLVKDALTGVINVAQATTRGEGFFERIISVGTPAGVIRGLISNFSEVRAAAEDGAADLEETAQRYATIINMILNPPTDGGEAAGNAVRDLAGMLAVLSGETDKSAAAAEKAAQAIAKQIEQLQFQSQYVHKSADELTLLKLAADGATESQLALARSALANIAAFEAQSEAEKKLAEDMVKINEAASGIAESLKSEEQLIRESYERRRQTILDSTKFTAEERQSILLDLEQQTNEKLNELNAGFWEKYLASLEENLTNMDTITADMLENLTSGFGSAFESMIFDAESLEDAVYKLAEGMLRSIVNALGQMAGQWLALQAVQLATGNATQAASVAAAAASGPAIAAAYAPAASMVSLASFGANSAPAMAGITATNALSKGLALAGMAHDGIDSVPQTGTWLLEKGERVTTADTSAKLDRTLSQVQSNMSPRESRGGDTRIINAWDMSMIGDYMGSSPGEKVIMNVVRKNQRTIKALAG